MPGSFEQTTVIEQAPLVQDSVLVERHGQDCRGTVDHRRRQSFRLRQQVIGVETCRDHLCVIEGIIVTGVDPRLRNQRRACHLPAAGDDAEAYGWALLRGVPDKLPVSRRQWAPAKAALTG